MIDQIDWFTRPRPHHPRRKNRRATWTSLQIQMMTLTKTILTKTTLNSMKTMTRIWTVLTRTVMTMTTYFSIKATRMKICNNKTIHKGPTSMKIWERGNSALSKRPTSRIRSRRGKTIFIQPGTRIGMKKWRTSILTTRKRI